MGGERKKGMLLLVEMSVMCGSEGFIWCLG